MLNITHYQRNANRTTMRYHLTLLRMAAIKKSMNNKCWRGCWEKGTPLHCWWEGKLVQPLWRTVWRFLKKLEIRDCGSVIAARAEIVGMNGNCRRNDCCYSGNCLPETRENATKKQKEGKKLRIVDNTTMLSKACILTGRRRLAADGMIYRESLVRKVDKNLCCRCLKWMHLQRQMFLSHSYWLHQQTIIVWKQDHFNSFCFIFIFLFVLLLWKIELFFFQKEKRG